jgi:hypothetical protein
MAHFYGNLQGSRGEATRMGTKNSGIEAHVRGWGVGIYVSCFVDTDGTDVCVARQTGGSNNPSGIKELGRVKSK